MTVNINVDLDASGVADDIIAIKTALETLDEKSGEINLGEKIDADGLTGSIGKTITKLSKLESKLDRVQQKIKNSADEIDFSDEITHVVKSETSGATNKGDSTGGDPPNITRSINKQVLDNLMDDIDVGDADEDGSLPNLNSPEHRQRLSDLFGFEVEQVMDREDFNEWKMDGAPWAKNRTVQMNDREMMGIHPKMVRGRFGRGLESLHEFQEDMAELGPEAREEILKGISSDGEEEMTLSEKKKQSEARVRQQAKQMRMIRDRGDLTDLDAREAVKRPGDGGFSTKVWNRHDIDFDGMEIDDLNRRFGKMGGHLKRLIPDMNQIYSVIAAIIPLAIVLGAQFLGVASAMAAVGVAGAAILGLGLVGHADSMSGSLAEAKEQMSELARESFQAAQGTAQMFAPIQSRMFAAIPGQIGQIADSMKGLTAYEGTLFTLGAMLSEGLQYSFRAIAENETAISQLAIRFGDVLGSGIIEFFGWLFKEARDNQDMLISLGGTLKDLATILFRVFRVLVMFLDAFSPLIDTLLFLSSALNNELVQALLGFALGAYLTAGALTKMGLAALKAYSFMAGGGMLKAIQAQFWTIQAGITRLIAHYTALSAAAASAAAMMAMTGVGLLAVGGGLIAANKMMEQKSGNTYDGYSGAGGSPSGRGGTQVYNDNRSYKITQQGSGDYADRKAMEQTIRDVNESDSARELPPLDN